MATWTNWGGNQHAGDITVARPRSVEEVAATVKDAAGGGRRVKPIGTGHSFTGIGRPEDIQLVLDHLSGLRDYDRDTGLVTVGAGTPLHRVNELLGGLGLAMNNLGDIDVQTIAGALATGTHGTGADYQGLGAQVVGLEMVLADGSIVGCVAGPDADPESTTPGARRELWSAARIGLGALGVVTAVTLQTVPLFALRAEEGPMRLDELISRFDELAAAYDHFEAYWFPHTDSTLTKRNTRLPITDGLHRLPALREWLDDEFLANTVFGWVVELGRRRPELIPRANRFAAGALGHRTFTDLSYKVFTSPRRVRFCEMELAIPRPHAVDAIREVVAAIERSEMHIPFPIELRVAAADDIPLSTACGRDSAYLAFHMPAGVDFRPYFALVAGVLEPYEPRPHWGKLHRLGADTLRRRYPQFDEFVDLRDTVDPYGLFTNRYLDRVLGPPPHSRPI
jgi:L-gulonolactone oxidase